MSTDDNPFPPLPEWPFESAVTGLVEVTDGPIDFTPVPRLRKRRNGWTPETQRAFIDALSRCGCVARAARAIGKASRGAYRLLESEGAESFAFAWDQAIARGVEALRWNALDRALHGAWVPVVRRGKIVSFEFRQSDRLAIALLSGRKACVADNRERASSRRKHRMKLAAEKKHKADEQRRREELWAEHQAIVEREEQDRRNRVCRNAPRIRGL